MAYQSKDGKNSNSRFRANRRDKAVQVGMESQPSPGGEPHPASKDKGARATANRIEAKPKANESEAQSPDPTEGSLSSQHGPASEVHITHDHMNGHHHVVATHADGHVAHSDHATADEAHMAGAAAGGVNPEGNYPMQHEQPEGEAPDGDDYDVEPLR